MFAWVHSDMIGISPANASHKLNVLPSTKVDNLLKAGFIREVKYPEWLANVVVDPKKGASGEYA